MNEVINIKLFAYQRGVWFQRFFTVPFAVFQILFYLLATFWGTKADLFIRRIFVNLNLVNPIFFNECQIPEENRWDSANPKTRRAH
jgi:hypothetical protein